MRTETYRVNLFIYREFIFQLENASIFNNLGKRQRMNNKSLYEINDMEEFYNF